MRVRTKTTFLLVITVAVLTTVILLFALPFATRVTMGLKLYETRVAERDNYKLHTTPLPKSVVADICLKLELEKTSAHCRSDVVYAPDFFDEIKVYFGNLADQDKTQDLVQDKLGSYLDYCETPDSDGHYRCRYDLRGDDVYPVLFYFTKDNFYYRIIANTGGS